nr:tandem-95 repeat protein [Gammaproteobacteria bacterium]
DTTTGVLSGTPENDDVGVIAVTVTATDGTASVTDTYNLTINNTNDAPVASTDSISTNEDTSVTFDVLSNDNDADVGDTLSVTSTSSANYGTVTINLDGTLTYTPISNFYGSDSFTYTVSDGNGGTDTATVNITINAVNTVVGTSASDVLTGTSGIDYIYGFADNDTLTGAAGADLLDGGTGQDLMTGGTGNDTFVIRSGDSDTDITLADIITDFTDGEDLLGGVGSIDSFSQLTVEQGTGSNTADTIITLTTTGEILAVLENFTHTDFDANDFVQLDIT